MSRLFGQTDPHPVLFILFGRPQRNVPEQHENDDDQQLDIREIGQRLEQLRLVEKDIKRLVVKRLYLDPGIDFGQFDQLLIEQVGVVQNMLGDQMRSDHPLIPVDQNERDVVSGRNDREQQRISRVGPQLTKRRHPYIHLVFLLFAQLCGHVVGEQQR